MKLVLQRVTGAGVSVNGAPPQRIGQGLVVLAGICGADDEKTVAFMAEKTVNLRIFEDENNTMNRSLLETGGDCLVISNFTLYASCRKGRRPSFVNAAAPPHAKPLYEYFVRALSLAGIKRVRDGKFGADMLVEIHNDGPVTIILDSAEIMPK